MRVAPALERVAPVAVAATVFAFGCGSSAAVPLLVWGRSWRWVGLGLLCALGLTLAALARRRLPLLLLLLAGALVALALLSAAWSVDPWLSARRAASLTILLLAAAAFSSAAAGRPQLVRGILLGVLVGAAAVALAGFVVLATSPDLAVQEASAQSPLRFRGLGQNPNTVPALLAVAAPVAVWLAFEARSKAVRSATVALFALFVGTTVAAGSRGGLLASFAACLVVTVAAARTRRAQILLAAALTLFFAAGFGAMDIPKAKPAPRASTGTPAPQTLPDDANKAFPLSSELGRLSSSRPVRRTLFSSSGRFDAWGGALETVGRRPVLGYGFGAEEDAFVDRYYAFESDLPENSYIGALLQLGAVGLAALLALVGYLAGAFFQAIRRAPAERALASACGGVLTAGLVLGLTQSFLFSVGNIATTFVWIPALLLVSLRPQTG